MLKSSRAFAASFMISRSESDPITMETRGLSGMKYFYLVVPQTSIAGTALRRLFECPCSDVAPVVHFFEPDTARGFVGFRNRVFEFRCASRHSQHAAAARIRPAVAHTGAGVEDLHVVELRGAVEPEDFLARHEAAGIAAGRHDHTTGSVA